MDSGSQTNFITQKFANKLQLKEQSIDISISGVVQGTIQAKTIIDVRVKSRFNNFCENIQCIILPKITQRLPQVIIAKQFLEIPKNLKLADPNFNLPANIDMLIGAELFWTLICVGQIRVFRTQPILQKTLLGWIVSSSTTSNHSNLVTTATNCLAVTEKLNHTLSRFWKIEHLKTLPTFTPEEQKCECLFKDTTQRNSEGRFVVQLPIKTDYFSNLGEFEKIAISRFKSLERRLTRSPKLYAEYKSFMQEYLQLDHMREITCLKSTNKTYYLPHHAVYKETSTTKSRV